MLAKQSISNLARQTREDAEEVTQRHKKLSSFRLYAVLAPCMELCERCERDPAERAELDRLFAEQPKEGNRRYVEKGSNIYQAVCRYVFHNTDGTNTNRYAQALNEAAKLQISSRDLEDWLKENGGVNALYFRRPLSVRVTELKVLRLNRSVTFSRDTPLRLVLQWQTDNTFKIIEEEILP